MADSEEFDTRPVRAFLPGPGLRVDESVWPASVAGRGAAAALLHDLAAAGSQTVVATHSPIVAAIPGATLLELGPLGHPARDLGRPEPGGRVAAVHAGPAVVFPAPVLRVLSAHA